MMHGNNEIGVGGALRTSYHRNLIRDDFCFQAKVEEVHGAYSPSLWKNNNNISSSESSSPLLPSNHQYSNLSRLQAIVEARKGLMEMIRDMPESNYELSLKDIVDEHQQKMEEEYKEDDTLVADERSFRFETEAQIKKMEQQKMLNKKKKMQRIESTGSNKFSRAASMDSEIFFIKMFFIPSCFGSKKKIITTQKNGSSKFSPRNSFEIHEDDHKEPRIRRIFSAIFSSSSSSRSSDSDSIVTSRLAGKYCSPGCGPFFAKKEKKSKARK